MQTDFKLIQFISMMSFHGKWILNKQSCEAQYMDICASGLLYLLLSVLSAYI